MFQCCNQDPDYNMALSYIQLLKQTLMSQYKTYLSCSQQIGNVPIYTFDVLQVLGIVRWCLSDHFDHYMNL